MHQFELDGELYPLYQMCYSPWMLEGDRVLDVPPGLTDPSLPGVGGRRKFDMELPETNRNIFWTTCTT